MPIKLLQADSLDFLHHYLELMLPPTAPLGHPAKQNMHRSDEGKYRKQILTGSAFPFQAPELETLGGIRVTDRLISGLKSFEKKGEEKQPPGRKELKFQSFKSAEFELSLY